MLNKQDLVNLFAKCITFIVNFIVTFFLTSFIVNTLGSEANGYVGLANEFVNYAQIFTYAINSMASRYVTIEIQKNDFESASEYFKTLLFANVFSSIIITVVGTIIIVNLEKIINISGIVSDTEVKILWVFVLINFVLSLIGTPYSISTFCKNRFDLESFRIIISSIIKAIILVFLFAIFKPHLFFIGLATLSSTIYVVIYNKIYTKKLLPEIHIATSGFSFEKLKVLISSGIWNSLTQLGNVLSSGLDLLVTNIFVGSSAMGLLSVGKTLPTYLFSLVSTAANIFTPNYVYLVAQNKIDEIIIRFKNSYNILSILTLVPLVLLVTIGDAFYSLWTPSVNSTDAYLISLVLVVGYLAAMPLSSVWGIYTAMNKVRIGSIYLIIESFANVGIELSIISLMTDDFNKILVIVGVSSLLRLIMSFIFIPVYTSRCLKINCSFMILKTIKNIILFVAMCIICRMISKLIVINSWPKLIFNALIISIIALYISFKSIYSKKERQIVLSSILKIMKGKR